MVCRLKISLESQTLWLRLICQQSYPALKDVNCSIDKDEL